MTLESSSISSTSLEPGLTRPNTWIAITREVSPRIADCELTYLDRQPLDLERARQQHYEYEDALSALGCMVQRLPAAPDLPDSVFVEDCALVLDELALLTRPGADTRKPEVQAVASALAPYRRLAFIVAPGIVDGGDILRLERNIYVGLSTRSNQPAIDQMQEILGPYGYVVQGVALRGCLHLKTAVTQVAAHTLLLNPNWVDPAVFTGYDYIEVAPSEPFAANAVRLDVEPDLPIIYPAAYPLTLERLLARGIQVRLVNASELAKAEGAVTCCSLLMRTV